MHIIDDIISKFETIKKLNLLTYLTVMSDNPSDNKRPKIDTSRSCGEKKKGASCLFTAGFEYTSDRDTARCKECAFEVCNWTSDMDLFSIHSKQQPNCSFVRSIITSALSHTPSSLSPSTNEQENSSICQYINMLGQESEKLDQVRRNTFSHWTYPNASSSEQMIDAGFFCCNVNDRVICISCNLICQQWNPHTDDPCEVHKTLSPDCMFVKLKLKRSESPPIINTNEGLTDATSNNYLSTPTNLILSRSNATVPIAASHSNYAEIPKRRASFATWSNKYSPPVEDLVQAGFFYTGKNTSVTCFYCNGSLQNWSPNDNPMIKHARWFPHCAYAKQLCGDEMYRKIQESKRAQQERAKADESRDKNNVDVLSNTGVNTNSRQLSTSDEDALSRRVTKRLARPISQNLEQSFGSSIIKKCWEDQLRLKQKDFVSDFDLYMACLVLQKQIEHIDGKKKGIIIPSESMRQHRERARKEQAEILSQTQTVLSANTTLSNPCVLCLAKEKTLACIPCGHLATCIPCKSNLRLCPICGQEIDAFVRIYL